MTRVAAILTCLTLAGCGVAFAQKFSTANLGAEITLAPGTTVSVKNAGIKVRLIAVTEDSRCPRDTTCVWAGEVKVQLEFHEASQAAWQVEIPEGGSADAGAYRVTLVRVEPQPTGKSRIAPGKYRATLKIDAST